jgi:hypothetical protein
MRQVGGGPFTREKEEEAHARCMVCSSGNGDVSGDGLAGEDRWMCCSVAPCSGSANQGKQRRGQQTWRHSGGGVCSPGRSSAAMGLRPGWSHDRGKLGGDGCVVELEESVHDDRQEDESGDGVAVARHHRRRVKQQLTGRLAGGDGRWHREMEKLRLRISDSGSSSRWGRIRCGRQPQSLSGRWVASDKLLAGGHICDKGRRPGRPIGARCAATESLPSGSHSSVVFRKKKNHPG